MLCVNKPDHMVHNQKVPDADSGITCLDDFPAVARLAERQQFLIKWYYGVGIAPFFLVVVIGLRFFHDSVSRIFDALVFISLAWAMAVAGYTFYLLFWLKCPRCNWRFGSGEKCNTCKLPRHRDYSGLFSLKS
jgi:hypothetical protein